LILPLEIMARIAFDAGQDGSFRVPIYSKREAFP
jgi:hypothetical protein